MSRIGRQPIEIPAGVTIQTDGGQITVTGPKGTLKADLMPGLSLEQKDSSLTVRKVVDDDERQKTFGLMRTIVNNLVVGVSKGYERKLEINGVGYRANVAGQ